MYNHHLDTYIEVAETGSFSKAAQKLYITTVSVMNQMNALEKHIGVKLFNRTNRGVTLTEAGESIYRDAKKMIADSDEAIARARQIAGQEQSVIRIGTSVLRPCRRLIDLWTKADSGKSSIRIKIVPFDDDPASLSAMMNSLGQDIDCFISPCDSNAWKRSYGVLPLTSSRCCIAMSRRHPLSKKTMLHWSDLDGQTLLLLKEGSSAFLDQMRREILADHPGVRIQDLPNYYDMEVFNDLERRDCLMEVPDVWTDVHPSIATIPMDWNYEMPFSIVYARKPSRAFEEFLSILTETRRRSPGGSSATR